MSGYYWVTHTAKIFDRLLLLLIITYYYLRSFRVQINSSHESTSSLRSCNLWLWRLTRPTLHPPPQHVCWNTFYLLLTKPRWSNLATWFLAARFLLLSSSSGVVGYLTHFAPFSFIFSLPNACTYYCKICSPSTNSEIFNHFILDIRFSLARFQKFLLR